MWRPEKGCDGRIICDGRIMQRILQQSKLLPIIAFHNFMLFFLHELATLSLQVGCFSVLK